MRFPRLEYWSRLPFPAPGDLPDPGIKPGSPALQADSLPPEPQGKSQWSVRKTKSQASSDYSQKNKKIMNVYLRISLHTGDHKLRTYSIAFGTQQVFSEYMNIQRCLLFNGIMPSLCSSFLNPEWYGRENPASHITQNKIWRPYHGLQSPTWSATPPPFRLISHWSEVMWSEVKSLSRVQLFATPWTIAYQAPQSTEFPRQEYWSGLPFPSQGIFPTQGSNLGLPHCRQMLYRLSHQGSPFPITLPIYICPSNLTSLCSSNKPQTFLPQHPCTSSPLWLEYSFFSLYSNVTSSQRLSSPPDPKQRNPSLLYLSSYHLMPPDILHICLFVSPTWKATPRKAGTYLAPFVYYCILYAW